MNLRFVGPLFLSFQPARNVRNSPLMCLLVVKEFFSNLFYMRYLKLKCYNYYANSHKQTILYNFQLNAILLIAMQISEKSFQSDRVQYTLKKWTILGFRIYCFKIK